MRDVSPESGRADLHTPNSLMEVRSITHLARELIPQGRRRTHHNLAQLMFI